VIRSGASATFARIPSFIQQDLSATGVAPAICVLRPDVALQGTTRLPDAILRHFVWAPESRPLAVVVALRRLDQSAAPDPRDVPAVRYYPNLGVAYGTVTRASAAALRKESAVRAVRGAPPIGLIRPPRAVRAALQADVTWGLDTLGVPALWDEGLTGAGIVVGHLDTGVDGTHPALREAIAAFAELDDLGREVTPAPEPHDTAEHGTHTAGTIAGRAVRGRHVGVAPGAMLASAAVIEGGDVVARVLGGIDWAVGQGIRVLSMSLGFRGFLNDFLPLTQRIRELGILPVFAIGNEGPGTSRSPANYPEALSVGASDEQGRVPLFSSSQEFRRAQQPIVPDLVAPGVGVVSARPGGGYQEMDGTSMATPHVAGLAALLLEAAPGATPDRIEQAIFASCARTPQMTEERANRGVPDAPRALEALRAGE
jgi:subtilisin family serine protease